MNLRRFTAALVLGGMSFVPMAAHAYADKTVVEAVEAYFDFADANAGTITAEQIPADDYQKFFILDVRDADQFAKEHIPGAANIEWRKVFAERSRLPKDKTILVYCNTSSFAAQVAMALRMDGFENVSMIYGGFNQWKAAGGMDAYARATRKN